MKKLNWDESQVFWLWVSGLSESTLSQDPEKDTHVPPGAGAGAPPPAIMEQAPLCVCYLASLGLGPDPAA